MQKTILPNSYKVKISYRRLTDLDINGNEGNSTIEAWIKFYQGEDLIEEYFFDDGDEYDFTNSYNLFKALADHGKYEEISTIAHVGSYTLVDREIKVSNKHIIEVLYNTIGSSNEAAKRLVDLVIENTISKIQNESSSEHLNELISKLILNSVREEELSSLKIYDIIDESLTQKV